MNTQPSELQTSRGRFFFWIGLAILPIFWVWWMRPAFFSRSQRRVGWGWTVCYLAVMVFFREPLGRHLGLLEFGYPVVIVRLGVALWVWLLFRLFSVGQVVIGVIMLTDVIAMAASLIVPALTTMGPSLLFLIFPVVPAVWHLMLEPYRRWRGEIDAETVRTVQGWIRRGLICSLLILCCVVWVYHMRH